MNFIKTFFTSTIMGMASGAAEEMCGVHIPSPKSKPKGKMTKPTSVPDQYNLKRRGLRNGDIKRTGEEISHLYRQVPRNIRKDPLKMELFLKNRDLGHIRSRKNGGSNKSFNTIFQNSSHNKRLNKHNMTPNLVDLQRRQNHYYDKHGFDSTKINKQMNHEIDNIYSKNRKNTPKNKGSKISGGSGSKSVSTTATKKGLHVIAAHTGAVVGKVAGKVIGKGVTKTVGKAVAKKIGQKVLKAIPIIGTGVAVVAGIATICATPYDPRSWISCVSDIGTSFLGPVGIAVDIAVQTGIECV